MIKKDSNLIILLFFAIILAILGSASVNARASEDVSGAILISVEAKNKPLNKVLNEMAQKTGYTFTVDPRWQNLPVTVSLNNVALHEALRVILKNFSVSIIQDNRRQKNIAIIIGDMTGSNIGNLNVDASGNFPNQMVPKKAIKTIPEEKKTADPLDMEIIPPHQPGDEGITLRELQTVKSRGKENLSNNIEVLPPEKPGEKGISQREFEQIRSRQKSKEPAPKIPVPIDIEVLPPEKPGEKGSVSASSNKSDLVKKVKNPRLKYLCRLIINKIKE